MVSTFPFHGKSRGSNPLGNAKGSRSSMVEQSAFNRLVLGSNPNGYTK